jgi:hypothetical protein
MTRTTVVEVRPADSCPACSLPLDVPSPGEERPDWTLDVRGWRSGREAAIAVEGLHDGLAGVACAVDVERPQTVADHPVRPTSAPASMRSAARCDCRPEFSLEVQAVLETIGARRSASCAERRAELHTQNQPRRNPVMVTTLGRTGSMLLMRMLASRTPSCWSTGPHRFEQRVASYWADVLLSLAEPTSYIRQIAPPPDVDDPTCGWARRRPCRGACETLPVQEWLGGEAVEAIAVTCQERIDALYDRVAATTDAGEAPLFAEKCNLRAAAISRSCTAARASSSSCATFATC